MLQSKTTWTWMYRIGLHSLGTPRTIVSCHCECGVLESCGAHWKASGKSPMLAAHRNQLSPLRLCGWVQKVCATREACSGISKVASAPLCLVAIWARIHCAPRSRPGVVSEGKAHVVDCTQAVAPPQSPGASLPCMPRCKHKRPLLSPLGVGCAINTCAQNWNRLCFVWSHGWLVHVLPLALCAARVAMLQLRVLSFLWRAPVKWDLPMPLCHSQLAYDRL